MSNFLNSPISPHTRDTSSSNFARSSGEKSSISINSSNQSSTLHHRTAHSHLPPPTPNADRRNSLRKSFLAHGITWWQVRRVLSRPLVWIIIIIFMIVWYSTGTVKDMNGPEMQARLRELFPPEITKDLRYWPASHNRIHYVGRWTTAPNRLRIDGAFPGVYFDLNVTNTSSVVLSLSNKAKPPPSVSLSTDLSPTQIPHGGQYSFSAASRLRVSAPPISLLALVDQEEWIVHPNATGLVSVKLKELDRHAFHTVRVVAPMTDDGGQGVIQLDGVWLDRGGHLLPVDGSIADTVHDEMDDFNAESEFVGKRHTIGLGMLIKGYGAHDTALKKHGFDPEEKDEGYIKRRKKLIEIVTDNPAHAGSRLLNGSNPTSTDQLLAGVMGWEYLIGEMFGVDHVSVGVGGMCLLRDCVNGTGSPSGLGDVFFRSGPVDSPHFHHPWPFSSYVPDVLVFNLGSTDQYSLTNYIGSYNRTMQELYEEFENTYVSLVKAVRSIAYPTHPSTIEMLRLGPNAYTADNSPATIPIFIMRPFSGEFEHASQGVVHRMRAEGDRAVYWLDTSGWLDFVGTETTLPDYFLDETWDPPRVHLTEKGNQKVAIYLHMHVCRFLADVDGNCAFLGPELYQGSVFDPSVATFERYIENEKERQMREMFWETDAL